MPFPSSPKLGPMTSLLTGRVSFAMASQYEYKPLCRSTRDVRLLRLLPTDNDEKSKKIPACQIFHASLDGKPEFLALSYVWGDTKDQRVILLEGYPKRVTANLYDAMMALRLSTEPIVIWIDSLCINQSDTVEKGWQVGLMGDIYRQAPAVIAWLGPADDSSDSVIDYLNEFGQQADACGFAMGPVFIKLWQAMVTDPPIMQEFWNFASLILGPSGMSTMSEYAVRNLLHSIDGWHCRDKLLPLDGLQRLFQRPWWGRIWVLQEIALPRHAEFLCGTKRISRRRFSAAYNAYYALWEVILFQSRQGRDLTPYHWDVLLTVSHRPKLMLSAWRIYDSSSFPLLALLRATNVGSVHHLGRNGYQHLESTDPRDRIFALLGLARDREELERRGIVADYQKSSEEIFTSVSSVLLEQGHVAILSLCRTLEVPIGLPSWTPDWSRPMPETLQDVELDHMALIPAFNASGMQTCPNSINILRNGDAINSILVKCYVYDKISEVGEVPRVPISGTCIYSFDWLYELLRLTYKRMDETVEFHHRLRAVVITSVGGVTNGSEELLERPKGDHLDTLCLGALHTLHQNIDEISQEHIRSELRVYHSKKRAAKPTQGKVGKWQRDLHNEYMRMSAGRAPFVTKKGHPGLSSLQVKRNDIIALVQGAQVPSVLRRNIHGKYTIVSEAYVDGIMDGEAVENVVWQNLEIV